MKLFVIGIGSIGGTLIDNLIQTEHELVGVSNSSYQYFFPTEAKPKNWREEFDRNKIKLNYDTIVLLLQGSSSIIFDCSNSNTIPYHMFFSNRIHIITANKCVLAQDYKIYQNLFNQAQINGTMIGYGATVCAGLPVVNFLESCPFQIESISGIFSGSISYIMNRVSSQNPLKNQKFSKMFFEAIELGYCETDPRLDVNGLDAARKTLLIARLIGFNISKADLEIETMIPSFLREISLQEFYDRISEFDQYVEAAVGQAWLTDKVLRYVTRIQNGKFKICLESFGLDHPFANLSGCENIVIIKMKNMQDSYTFKGPGSGTQSALLALMSDFCTFEAVLDQ